MLSDYQTRVFEGLDRRLSDLIGAVRQLTEALRHLRATQAVPETAWEEVEATLRRLQALERCQAAFGRGSTDLADSPPVRRLYSQQLRALHQQLHGLAGTSVEGYIAEDA